jgi:integrase
MLPEAEKYTGHSFRRSSATILVNAGADITALKRHGGWKSTTVAEGYIDTSMNNKMDSANKIINAVQASSSPAAVY